MTWRKKRDSNVATWERNDFRITKEAYSLHRYDPESGSWIKVGENIPTLRQAQKCADLISKHDDTAKKGSYERRD